jgi:hypothetical protein
VTEFIGSPKRVSTLSNNANNASGSGAGERSQNVIRSTGRAPAQSMSVNEAASGSVEKSQNSIRPTEHFYAITMDVKGAFDSGRGSQSTLVFSLCHVDYKFPYLFVSYEWYIDDTRAPSKKFREGGEFVKDSVYKGLVSVKRVAKGNSIKAFNLHKFTKSLVAPSYRLDSKSSGKAELYKVIVNLS